MFVLDKARKERKRLTAIKGKRLYPLRPVIVRYADVFRAAGLNYTETFTSLYEESPAELSGMASVAGIKKGKWIGVAPFAKHRGKIYPVDEMEQVVACLSKCEDYTVFCSEGEDMRRQSLNNGSFNIHVLKVL